MAFFVRQCDAMQNKAALSGALASPGARQLYLFASWLALAAVEVNDASTAAAASASSSSSSSLVTSRRARFYRTFVDEIDRPSARTALLAAVSAKAAATAAAILRHSSSSSSSSFDSSSSAASSNALGSPTFSSSSSIGNGGNARASLFALPCAARYDLVPAAAFDPHLRYTGARSHVEGEGRG